MLDQRQLEGKHVYIDSSMLNSLDRLENRSHILREARVR